MPLVKSVCSVLVIAAVLVSAAGGCGRLDADAARNAASGYDVRILRDTWGVPHVFGATDAACAFGLAYAQSEDDFATLQEVLLMARGEYATVKGKDVAPIDYMLRLFRVREVVDAKYESDLTPETRALCEAYAAGVNLYAAEHPRDVVKRGLFPATGRDIVAGFVQKVPFFFFLQNSIQELFEKTPRRPVSQKTASTMPSLFSPDSNIGSNTFAVAPSRSADGWTRLAVNSHQPWTGPVAWYEAHLKSDEGLDIVGGTFPGGPVIFHGHNRHLGWAHTVNRPDLADIYALEVNPENKNQYKFDGEWRDFESGKTTLWVRVLGPIRVPIKREVLWCEYGPAVRTDHGVYAIRYAGWGDIRQVEQWFRMGKANNFDEWMDAVRMRSIPSFNMGYADAEGNIYYLYNAMFPIRAKGYDWTQYLPGNTSETLWTDFLPFEQLPQVKNPASGFVINCNSTPYKTTLDPENPRPEDYAPETGVETAMTNRAARALELFGGDDSITREEFYTYKLDKAYSLAGPIAELYDKVLGAPLPEDPVVQEAIEVLKNWDRTATFDSVGTAIAVLTFEPVLRAQFFGNPEPDVFECLSKAAHILKDTHGNVAVPWREVNFMRRGSQELPLEGGPDTLRAVYGHYENGRIYGTDGDCYILMVEWDPEGKVRSESIHQFGSATLDEASPHYADQMPLFAKEQFKPVWLDEADIRANLEREYRPGQ